MKKLLIFLPLTLSLSATARADLAYTQVTSSPFTAMMSGGGGIMTKVYAKGEANRTEAQMFGRKTITISRGAQNVIQLDPATKTYTSSHGGSAGIAKSMMAPGTKMPSMSLTVSTQKLGTETVRGVKAPHFRINMGMKMNTPRGPQNMKMGMEIWGSNVAYPTSAKTRTDALRNLPDNFKTMFGSSAKVQGDLKGMSAAFGTVPLRMKMLMNGQPISTMETTGISTKALPASLFAVPAGYRAISNAQFAQMQRAALQKSMAGLSRKK